MKNLKELYQEHTGKSSDKWNIYLNAYDEILSTRKKTLNNLLEIGVQNGGSLEIWRKYFPNALNVVGCDINTDCEKLEYEDPAIKLVIGDSSTEFVKDKIAQISRSYDVIIDDGSHNSSDIIKSFLLYFPLVEDNGIYIIEDLHCSYWAGFEGGLYDPYSSMGFLKKLADITNFEHWGIKRSASEYLEPFYEYYECKNFDQIDYSQIHSVTFINSLCIIHKRPRNENILGLRNIVGDEEKVVSGNKAFAGTENTTIDQSANRWSQQSIFPEMEWEKIVTANINFNKEVDALSNEINELRNSLDKSERDIVYHQSIEDVLRKEIDQITDDNSAKKDLIERLSYDNNALLESTSWKITKPIRKLSTLARKGNRGLSLCRKILLTYGLKESISRTLRIFRRSGFNGIVSKLYSVNQFHQSIQSTREIKTLANLTLDASIILMPKVLIIAEMSIPQCKKYRVDQKIELFKKLDIPATSLSWTNTEECLAALQHHSIIIFYRVPAFEPVMKIFDECERLNLLTFWEVDDLIFNEEILSQSKTLHALDKDTFKGLIDGARLYHEALIRCKNAIASTLPLANAMMNAGSNSSFVIENALDPETIIIANNISENRKSELDGIVRIVYGSGTSTHNVDFLEASDAILSVLESNRNVHFRLVGELDLPESFGRVKPQIERVPLCTYKEYLGILAECDISIAPLEDYIFNDSKSNIKFIEASIVGLPSLCSPRPNFTSVIKNGENGFICQSKEDWEDALNILINDANLRNSMGSRARDTVLKKYSPEHIAEEQVTEIIKSFKRHLKDEKKHVMSVNCFYSPRSFGGATIVAEALNKRFANNDNFTIHVLTSLTTEYGSAYSLKRYESYGQECYGIVLPDYLPESEQIVNKNIEKAFIQALDIVKPDLIHFHSIQGLGVTMLEICSERDIPIVITTHDFWWLYDHQFILSFDDKHKLRGVFEGHDSELIKDDELNYYLLKKRKALSKATKIISPSEYTAKLYRHEGFKGTITNKNGVEHPSNLEPKKPNRQVRFGYVGGNTDIKGYHLIKEAFSRLSADEASLTIVDNTLNLGFRSFSDNDLKGLNNFKVVPAFAQDDIDDFYNSIDVLLSPTQAKESFGLTVREALIRNVWVITSDAGGAPEDIIFGENGIVIPFNNNADDLYKAIKNTLIHFSSLNPDLDIQLPHSHIRSFDEQYKELETIYNEILS